MNFQELVNAVVIETARPDLGLVSLGGDGYIPQQVKASLLSLHSLDYYYKDIKSAQLIFDVTAYLQTLSTQDLVRFRSLSYFRKNDPSLATYQQNPNYPFPGLSGVDNMPTSMRLNFLKLITPNDILDEFGSEKTDVFYQAGDTISIKSSTSLMYGLIGFYQYPNLTVTDTANSYSEALFDSWIARELPYAPIFHAANATLVKKGDNEKAAKAEKQMAEQIAILRNSNIVAEGY
jgi:hypothetical protein